MTKSCTLDSALERNDIVKERFVDRNRDDAVAQAAYATRRKIADAIGHEPKFVARFRSA